MSSVYPTCFCPDGAPRRFFVCGPEFRISPMPYPSLRAVPVPVLCPVVRFSGGQYTPCAQAAAARGGGAGAPVAAKSRTSPFYV